MFSGAIRLIKLGAKVGFGQTCLTEDTDYVGVTVSINGEVDGSADYELGDTASMDSLNEWLNGLADAIERGEYGVVRFAQ